MQARDEYLTRLMQGPKQWVIPIFQRTYSWTHTNCDQLFRDIINVGRSQHIQSHFVGSLVLISSQETTASIPQWLVIDGQQRLTTVTLLISALLERADELGVEVIAATQVAALREYYLVNTYGEGDAKYKLLLTKGDKPTLCSILDQKPMAEDGSANVKNNYQYFCEAIADVEILEDVYKGLQRLKVVEVVLQASQDDPQAIFESLNSTGVDLNQADLIRNFVLMRQPHNLQTSLYEEHWFPMEQAFGHAYSEKFDRFAQDFLTLMTASNTLLKARDVYPTFKQWFTEGCQQNEVSQVLSELCCYARFYTAFSLGKETDPELKLAFRDLRELIEVATPVVLKFYSYYENESVSKSDFIEALKLLSSYVLRRSVCDMQTRSLGNIFSALAHRVNEEEPLISLKVALARFSKNSRYPNDTEFRQALINKDLYESNNCRYVLDRLQNNSKEKVDTMPFTIEHVMPQNSELRKEWRVMLGENWQEIQETWLHRLGNLTLTGYNSEYQDKPFDTKKTITGGFNDSPLRLLNKDIQSANKWTEVEMEARANRLAVDALSIWPSMEIDPNIVASYILEEKKKLGEQFNVDDVGGINELNKKLFIELQSQVMGIGQDISLIISGKNLTFYTLTGFLQAVPRKRCLALVLALDYEELAPELQEICSNTHDWSFISNATLQGVYCEVADLDDIPKVLPLIQLAYSEALS